MLKRVLIGILCISLVVLPACSLKTPIPEGGSAVTVTELPDGKVITEYNGNSYTQSGIESAMNGCRVFVQKREENRHALAMTINDDQLKAMVVVHGQVTDMVTSVWGSDLCEPGTNEFDAYVAYAEQQGAIIRTATEVGGGVLKTGLIAGFTYMGVDAIMGAVGPKVGGDMIQSDEAIYKVGDVDSSKTTEVSTEVNSQAVSRNTGNVNAPIDEEVPEFE